MFINEFLNHKDILNYILAFFNCCDYINFQLLNKSCYTFFKNNIYVIDPLFALTRNLQIEEDVNKKYLYNIEILHPSEKIRIKSPKLLLHSIRQYTQTNPIVIEVEDDHSEWIKNIKILQKRFCSVLKHKLDTKFDENTNGYLKHNREFITSYFKDYFLGNFSLPYRKKKRL